MNDIKVSKYLSYILRHHPEDANIELDEHGYTSVETLIRNIKYDITMQDLERIVREDEKKRYSFNNDKTKIRANQGHSVFVNLDLPNSVPPEILFHGTSKSHINDIMRDGIKPMSRIKVHLSKDYGTAVNVGSRHGKPVVLKVLANKAWESGVEFQLTENGYWLTDYISPEFIEIIK